HNRSGHRRLDILGATEVAFGDHLRLAVHASHLAQVPVGLPLDLLRVQTRHISTLGHTPKPGIAGPPTGTSHRSDGIRPYPPDPKINLSRTLGLAAGRALPSVAEPLAGGARSYREQCTETGVAAAIARERARFGRKCHHLRVDRRVRNGEQPPWPFGC